MSNRRVVAVLGAVVLAGTLAACSGGQPGAAAIVGDRVIPTSDVDTASRELAGIFQDVPPSAFLSVLVQEPVVRAHAEEAGLGVSVQQAQDQLAQAAASAGGDEDQEFSPASVTVMRYALEMSVLQQAPEGQAISSAILDELTSQDVTINPRYGSLAEDGTIGVTTYPWLVASNDVAALAPQ